MHGLTKRQGDDMHAYLNPPRVSYADDKDYK